MHSYKKEPQNKLGEKDNEVLLILSFVFMSDLDDSSDYWEDGMAESTLKELADNGKKDASSLFLLVLVFLLIKLSLWKHTDVT